MLRSQGVRVGVGVLAAGLVTATAGLATPASAAPVPATRAAATAEPAVISIVHGVRGLVADVRLDGRLVLSGFAPERITDPLQIPAGRHRVQIWPTGADKDSTPLLDEILDARSGQQATAAVGLDAQGEPALTVYDDAALLSKRGSTALVVRGLAETSAVRVDADDSTIADSLTASQEEVKTVEPGTYKVSAKAASGGDELVPAQDVPVAAGRAVVLYLIGSEEDSTLGWVAQTVRPSVTGAPLRVDTGVGPIPEQGPSPALLLLVPAGLAVAVGARARRRPARA